MRTLFRSLLLGTAALLPLTAVHAHDGWYADFDEAAKVAKKENKDLLVDFTGSDWCGWCIKLNNEVFDHEQFLTAAKKDFVLVALDFPKAQELKDKVPNPERNDELKNQWGVRGFPTIMLVTADGDAYARTGYRQGGPEPYVEHLNELRSVNRARFFETLELVKKFEKAEGEARAALMKQALEKLEGVSGDDAAAPKLAIPVKAYFKTDPDNAAGHKLRAVKALMGADQMDAEVRTAAKELDPKNEKGLLESVVEHQVRSVGSADDVKAAIVAIEELDKLGIKDKEKAIMLYLSAADWSNRILGDAEKAKAFATKARPYAEGNQRALDFIDRLLNG